MTKRKTYLLILITLIVLYVASMSIFTFFDYQITSSLYNPGTTFGKIFEATGPMFMPFVMMFSTVGLIIILKFKKKSAKVLAYIGLGFCYIYATFMGVMTHKHSYAPWMFIPSIVLYVLFTTFTILLDLRIKKEKPEIIEKYTRFLFVIFITGSVSLIGVDIIKSIFGRVRYLYLTNKSDFKYWFYINKFDFNSSFPSGHASRAMTTICFSLIPLYFGKKKLSLFVEAVGIIFAITVAISRMYEGMHYPTDLITGLLLTYLAFFISRYNFLFKNAEIN